MSVLTVTKYEPTLMHPSAVPTGKVYSWGLKEISYLRVRNGSVELASFHFVPLSHPHFSLDAPAVQVADKADLCITYRS